MSKVSDKLEADLTKMINAYKGECLPLLLPDWLMNEGIEPGAIIEYAEGIGSLNKNNKTDVIIYLRHSQPLKISAKLANADYFGNWYGHKRFIIEFGEEAFQSMTKASVKWANNWITCTNAPFVGVSICFGRRSGKTGQQFTDIFTSRDILTVAKGFGTGNHVANCMYISDFCAKNMNDLLTKIQPITEKSVQAATEGFMIAHRPINPMTEGTNRGKNVYCRFQPFKRLENKIKVTTPRELIQLGSFAEVGPNCLNHNHILNDLEQNYNIYIPRKSK